MDIEKIRQQSIAETLNAEMKKGSLSTSKI